MRWAHAAAPCLFQASKGAKPWHVTAVVQAPWLARCCLRVLLGSVNQLRWLLPLKGQRICAKLDGKWDYVAQPK